MTKIFFVFILFGALTIFAQTDWKKWEAKEISYLIQTDNSKRDYSLKYESFSQFFSKSLILTYWIFFSDLDGDNCPHHPSCSNFLLRGVKETNIFQGAFMFFDRFTRDSNIFNRSKKYARYKNGRYFDPHYNYLLDETRIAYQFPNSVVTEE